MPSVRRFETGGADPGDNRWLGSLVAGLVEAGPITAAAAVAGRGYS